MIAVSMGACFAPGVPADRIEDGVQPPIEPFLPDASTEPTCALPDPSPLSTLEVTVRTTPAGGRFAPRNVGAIWIEQADGTFVRTLERWGQTRVRWLKRFLAATNNNVVDAVTGATRTSHTTHALTWDLVGLELCEIPNGDYRVVMELTDGNMTGPSLEIPFTKGTTPIMLTPADTAQFHDLEVVLAR